MKTTKEEHELIENNRIWIYNGTREKIHADDSVRQYDPGTDGSSTEIPQLEVTAQVNMASSGEPLQ
jgi:hypothetical protein